MDAKTPIKDIMTKPVIVTDESHNLKQVQDLFSLYKLHHLVITKSKGDDTVVGIVSSNDLSRYCIDNPQTRDYTTVLIKEVMTRNVISVSASATLEEVVAHLANSSFSALPITEDGKVKGIFTLKDIARILNFQYRGETYEYS